ncbi:MAG: PorT family protein [Bacteroidales bacterium]|nr:PorT family protein [Bacteroidales bacterium]MBQ8573235.1 PorT family protein [Bacteroidales bacterium]
MKRLFATVVAALALCCISASAQAKWGVTAGLNFNTSKFSEIDVKAKTGWSAGATCLVDLPLGFSIQPSLLYHQKGANITNEIAQNMGFIELPVSVQWGPDLLVFRPFLDVTPYIGYALSNEVTTSLADFKFSSWQGKERFEYGLGIGAGINVWKLQLIARYNWNFGSLYNVEGWDDIKSELKGLSAENENFGGVTLSLAFLF